MNAEEFRASARDMIDYVADYTETISQRPPLAQVQPGYLKDLIPDRAPVDPEPWKDVFGDIERVIMPGVTHWNSPHFHAYYPAGNSYPSILADMLSDAIGSLGFSWAASPASTELEMITLNWLGKMLELPEDFMMDGNGVAVIQGAASEATLFALLAARTRKVKAIMERNPGADEGEILSKLVIYTSDQAHSSVERAGLLGGVICHKVESDEKESMRGEALRLAIEEDKRNGLVPFFCAVTLGTTGTCAFDNLQEIGPECQKEEIWLHIDAAYAGAAFICPEYRHLLNGVEFADSFNFNPHKWLLVNFDLSALWIKQGKVSVNSFRVDPSYLRHANEDKVLDFRHWGISFGRRFRSLKLWFVLRLYGLTGLQAHIRKQVALAKEFESLVKSNSQFEVTHDVILGLVCFRIKGENELNQALLRSINADGRIHIIASESKGIHYLRFAVGSAATSSADIQYAWKVIQEVSEAVLKRSNSHINKIK